MREPDCSTSAALATAFSASNTASRRRHACMNVSPGSMTNKVRPGEWSGDDGSGAGLGASATTAAAGGVAAKTPFSAVGCKVTSRFSRGFLCLAGLCPSSRLSQSRMVSRPTSIPNRRNPPTSDSIDAPPWRSRNTSSRCGSSRAVAWLRGQRARSTASAKVSGRAGVIGDGVGVNMATDWQRYGWRPGGAMVTVGWWSKRIRLDVGVLTYFFLWFFLNDFSSLKLLLRLSCWILRLVDVFRFSFDELVQSLRLDFLIIFRFSVWSEWIFFCFSRSVSCSLSPLEFCGGRLC